MVPSLWFFLLPACEDLTRNSRPWPQLKQGREEAPLAPVRLESFEDTDSGDGAFHEHGGLTTGQSIHRGPAYSQETWDKAVTVYYFFFFETRSLPEPGAYQFSKTRWSGSSRDPPARLWFHETGTITPSCLHECREHTWVLISLDLYRWFLTDSPTLLCLPCRSAYWFLFF